MSSSTIGAFDLHDETPLSEGESKQSWAIFGAFALLTTIAYGNMLSYTAVHWSKGLYSHGWLVPLFAGYLLWVRRRPFVEVESKERWIGVGMIAAALSLRLYASYYDYNNFERLSFLVVLLGCCVLVGGWWMVRWAGPAVGFLAFMFPLPWFLENSLLLWLQNKATAASTIVFQLMGLTAVREGNVIYLDDAAEPLTVAEACSGLRMLTIFGAMCVAVALLSERPWWDRLAVLVAAVPIAVASNIIRIVVTGLLYTYVPGANEAGLAHKMVHDFAGFGMMFIGMGLLAVLMAVLRVATVPEDDDVD
ncbi:MAG: exosortase/archaeosortase family protein [Planctomycetales bacterium]|nr:exosortase/archaeosortase family protein [Planctomycetales bacterium]